MENKNTKNTVVTEEQPKKSNKERLKEITDSIEQGIKEVYESDKYRNYLKTMSRFHNYSVNNTMLIYMQKPDATFVAGFNKWHDKFGRNVKKGEHGIKIIAPAPFKKKIKEQRLDPDTKLPLFDKDGKPVMEEKTVKIPMFKPISVFDVSQTEGKELPELAATLHGKVDDFDRLKDVIQKSAPVPIIFANLHPNMDGYFSITEQNITIRDDMSEPQTICAMIHEIAHSLLHNTKSKETDPKAEEVEAESIAYTVCKYLGIDTSENSFGYIAAWSKDKDVKELKESLETISLTSSQLISRIEKEYKAIEKIKEPKSIQKDNPESNVTIQAMNDFGYFGETMCPLSKDRAMEIYDTGCPIYLLHDDNTENEVADKGDIISHSGFFGIEKNDKEKYSQIISESDKAKEKEKEFLCSSNDGFAIYQLRNKEENAHIHFLDSSELKENHIPVCKENYICIYTGSLNQFTGTDTQKLDAIYEKFNIDFPPDFKGHSLSVSDILALKQGDNVTYNYVDNIGYTSIPNFDKEYLKTAELSIEDDANMIDGIINNGIKEEPESVNEDASLSKQSVIKKLNDYKEQIVAKSDNSKSKERSIEP